MLANARAWTPVLCLNNCLPSHNATFLLQINRLTSHERKRNALYCALHFVYLHYKYTGQIINKINTEKSNLSPALNTQKLSSLCWDATGIQGIYLYWASGKKKFSLLSLVIHKVSELQHSMVWGLVANRKFTEIYLVKGKYQKVLHWLLYFLIRQIDGR